MKKLIATCIFLTLAAAGAAAQNFSAGLRTGSSCWTRRAQENSIKMEAMPGQHRSWDNELFVRWQGKGRWAFEGSLSHSALTKTETVFVIDDSPPYTQSGYFISTRRSDNYDLVLSAQYDITCAHMKACPRMRRFRSYAGVSIIPTATQLTEGLESSYLEPNGLGNLRYQLWTGFSHTIVYNATPHLAISSVAECRVAPAELLSNSFSAGDYRPSARMGFRIGAAYRFSGNHTPHPGTKMDNAPVMAPLQ